MTDPVDDWAAEGLREYRGKPMISAMRADLKLDGEGEKKEEKERLAASLKPLLDRIQSVLEKEVREVRVSERLTDSPCCLVLTSGTTPAFMERLLKERGRDVPHAKRIFEINGNHPLVVALAQHVAKDASAPRVAEWIEVLYDQALLSEGSPIGDPNRFAKRVAALLTAAAGSV